VLKDNGIAAMLGDQAAPKENIKVDFFIKDVPTFEGTAKIAIKTKAVLSLRTAFVFIQNKSRVYLFLFG
jgi:lauroyl/myristoyl acyltransferase